MPQVARLALRAQHRRPRRAPKSSRSALQIRGLSQYKARMFSCRSLLALLASMVVCACGSASHNGAAFEPLHTPKARFETETAKVFVKDERRGVSPQRAFDTPVFSWPGNGETRAIPASSDAHASMAALLKRWVPGVGSDRLYFEVYVQRADAGWVAHFWSEEAWAAVEVRVCAFDGTDNSVLVAGRSHSSANAHSADITDGEPAR